MDTGTESQADRKGDSAAGGRVAPTPSPRRPLKFHLLAGLNAIVTGGTTGIGRAIALAYLSHGCSVVVNHLPVASSGDDQESGPAAPSSATSTSHTTTPGLHPGAEALRSMLAEAAELRRIDPQAGELRARAGDVRDPATAKDLVDFASQPSTLRGGVPSRQTPSRRRLDVCVSNAGVCVFSDFLETPSSLAAETMETNLMGAYHVVQAAARHMARVNDPPGGSIIGISSISALVGGAGQVHYTPTKAGVTSLMQSAACALGKYGIRCNAILPGTIETQLNLEDLADSEEEVEVPSPAPNERGESTMLKVKVKKKGTKRKYMESRIPLGRIGRPEDVAGPAVFLACEELSGYMTGSQVLVDGGLFVNLQ